MIVSDASPLIYLSKIAKLRFLREKFGKILLPRAAFEEIVKGKSQFAEVDEIERSVGEGWLEVVGAKGREVARLRAAFPNLGPGEVEAIEVSRRRRLPALLDDSQARRIAEALGVNVHGTLFVVLRATENRLVGREEVVRLVDRLIEAGFRISIELYSRLLSELKPAGE